MIRKKSLLGFTLIELVVTIAILGILAGLAVPAVAGLMERAEERALAEDAVRINRVYETWRARGGTITRLGIDNPTIAKVRAYYLVNMLARAHSPSGTPGTYVLYAPLRFFDNTISAANTYLWENTGQLPPEYSTLPLSPDYNYPFRYDFATDTITVN